MIELVQSGQAGKTTLLFDMHRLRTRVFKDSLQWPVHVNQDGLEVDEFDLPEAVYLLALDDEKRVIGSWRILPTTGPTMIRDVWPHYLETLPMPVTENVWEVSRFGVSPLGANTRESILQSQKAVAEMFCALTELCIKTGIQEVYTLYDNKIARVIRRLDCQPYKLSAEHPIDGVPCQIGAFRTDRNMLQKLREKTGIKHSLLESLDLPPALASRIAKKHQENVYA
jgi:N-acyl-L-homoserine lactone synthetase